jgi:hypothetical protein
VSLGEEVDHAVEEDLAELELDEDLELVLLGLEEADEEVEGPLVEEGLGRDDLVEEEEVERRVLGPELEVRRLRHLRLHPPDHAHGHDGVPGREREP